MRRKLPIRSIAIVVVVFAGASFLFTNCRMKPVAPHQGDGEFQNLSRWAGPFPLPGYSISMPSFDLGQPFRAEYQVAGLTDIGRECGVPLAVSDPQTDWGFGKSATMLDGSLELELLDSKGTVIVSTRGRLGEYTWMGWNDIRALYKSHGSFFKTDPRERYRFLFTYEPDPKLAGYRGYAYLLCQANL
jgi:hypothetical protein